MCGIAGFSGVFDRDLLEAMSTVISHRGPDDSGVLFEPARGIGLAHRRLSIIDLTAAAHQPMWDCTNTAAIVFNGEIYNYRELRCELEKLGRRFKSDSDTEVLLNLYLEFGNEMFSRINGMFAFALWDARIDSLILARDGLGVKPFYYAETAKGFLFASEMKAILQDESLDCALDQSAVAYYLTYLWSPASHTMLAAIKKLEPGYALIVRKGRIQNKWCFYDLPYNQNILEIRESEAVELFRERLKTAVKRQMVSDVEVGAFLSGGLDSSSVVAFAKDHVRSGKMKCFTIQSLTGSFSGEGFEDDLPYAKLVASRLGVELHVVNVDFDELDLLEKMVYFLDEPQADPSAINVFFISELARRHEIKVLLSGVGGDDILAGYRRHIALTQERFWDWSPLFLRQYQSRLCGMLPTRNPFFRRLRKWLQYADYSRDERLASYFYWVTPVMLRNLLSPDFREGVGREGGVSAPLLSSLARLPEGVPALNRMLYLDGKHFLSDHNLNYTDKMSMASGVEVRVPLLDVDLVSFSAALPMRFKFRGMNGKWVFKKAMEPYLSREITHRSKTGFGVPVRKWLHGEKRVLLDEVLSERAIKRRGIFSPVGVREFIESDRKGLVDGAYTILAMICVELWCRIFVDGGKRKYEK